LNNTPDLLGLVVHLRALQDGEIPATHGQYVRAAFLSMVSNFSTTLAEQLHGNKYLERPFTVSHLHSPPLQKTNNYSIKDLNSVPAIFVRKGTEYWIRITSLKNDVTENLLKIFQSPPSHLKLLDIPFQIVGLSRKDHKRAGIMTYVGLMDECLGDGCQPPSLIGLNFLSATTIHSQGRNQLFPFPSLIFPRLLSRWNHFSPEKICNITRKLFDQSLMISGYHLRTHMLDFGSDGREIGFVGYCEYQTDKGADIELLKIIHLLGRFSFFSGIGYGTPKGMGQIEFIIP
jgi:CRISPR-associated endoribonuclease Cas6